jgi:CubicO group peptidase (beta-lactamase class C family)
VGKNGNKIISRQSIERMRTNILDEKRLKIYRSAHGTAFGYGYGYGVRVKMSMGESSNFTVGEFGWDGAAGFAVSIEPENELIILYAQHVLNPHNYENHNRIKNFVLLALFD